MRLVFINRQGKIMVHELPKEDVDTCLAILNAFSHENVLHYYKTVSEMDIKKSLDDLRLGFKLVPNYKVEGYLNLVDEIMPDAFKVLKYGLCNLVRPHVPEQLYTFLTSDEIVTKYCLLKNDKNRMREIDYRYSIYDGVYYIRHLKPLKDQRPMFVVRDYDNNELDAIEVQEGDLILLDEGFRVVGEVISSFGLSGADGCINNIESIEIGWMFNADTKKSREFLNIDPEKKYLELREMFGLRNAGSPLPPTWEEKLLQQHEEVKDVVRWIKHGE